MPGEATRFEKGRSGNPGGKLKLQPDLDRASKLLTAEQRKALGLEPDQPMTPAQLRALWWATVVPIVAAGPKGTTDSVFRYAHQETGNRLMGKAREIVEFVEPRPEREVDWSKVPIEERRTLLAALDRVDELAEAAGDDAEE